MVELAPGPGHPALSRQLPAACCVPYGAEGVKACWAPCNPSTQSSESRAAPPSQAADSSQGEPRSVWFYVSLPMGELRDFPQHPHCATCLLSVAQICCPFLRSPAWPQGWGGPPAAGGPGTDAQRGLLVFETHTRLFTKWPALLSKDFGPSSFSGIKVALTGSVEWPWGPLSALCPQHSSLPVLRVQLITLARASLLCSADTY